MLKKIVIRIMIFTAFLGTVIFAMEQLHSFVNYSKGREVLDRDAYLLQQILEDENCLSNDVIGTNSQYAKFVNEVLRQSETDIFKYDIQVSSGGQVKANDKLGNNGWRGITDSENPLQVEYTSYADAPQRGSVITATLTLNVYSPAITNIVKPEDEYSKVNHRILTKITKEVKVIGRKYYKGKA